MHLDVTNLKYAPHAFKLLFDTPLGVALWRFLRRSDNIVRMQTATDLACSPLEALSPMLLDEFGRELADERIKQMIGHMVGQIMGAVGYESDGHVRISCLSLFSSGTRYRPKGHSSKPTKITPTQRAEWLRCQFGDRLNQDIDALVRDEDGNLLAHRLSKLAAEYDLGETHMAHLMPHRRRLNIGVMLREKLAQQGKLALVSADTTADTQDGDGRHTAKGC